MLLDVHSDLFDLRRRQETIGPCDVQEREDRRDARRTQGNFLVGGCAFGHQCLTGSCASDRARARNGPVISRLGISGLNDTGRPQRKK